MPSSPSGPPTDSEVPCRPARGRWGLLSLAIPVVTGLLLSWHSLGDLDIWFHLKAGREILDGQGVSLVNRYSFTEPDHPWVNHEWMFQVLTAVTGPSQQDTGDSLAVGGWNVLRAALTALLLLGIFGGDGIGRRLRGQDGILWSSWVGFPILGGLLLLWPRLTLRPELLSYFFIVLLIREIEQFLKENPLSSPTQSAFWWGLFDPRRPCGRVFLITLVWAQFHGFVALAPILLLLGGILKPLQNRLADTQGTTGPGWMRFSLLLLLTLLALVLTPNGVDGLLMPVRALTQFQQTQVDLQSTVSELAPLQDSPNSLALTITIYKAGLICGVLWIAATLGRISPLRVLLFFLAAAGAWANQRSIGFFGIAFILLFTGAPHQPWRFALPRRLPSLPHHTGPIAGLVLLLAVAGSLWPALVNDSFYLREGVGRRFGAGVNPARYPVEAARIIPTESKQPFFANLDAAAFLLAHTSRPIFIDGRTEAYSAGLWAEYLAIKKADDGALLLLGSHGVKSVGLATGGGSFDPLVFRLLESRDWELVSAEGAGLLFNLSGDPSPGQPAPALLAEAASRTLALAESGSSARRADQCLAAGGLYMYAGNESAREKAYRQGLSQRQDHPVLNHNLGNILLGRQDFTGAFEYFRIALEQNSRLAGSALNAGVCQMRLGAPAEAARYFARATGIDPGKFEAWANLAVALHRTGDRHGAVKALEKAVELRPGDPRLKQRLTEWKRGTG